MIEIDEEIRDEGLNDDDMLFDNVPFNNLEGEDNFMGGGNWDKKCSLSSKSPIDLVEVNLYIEKGGGGR